MKQEMKLTKETIMQLFSEINEKLKENNSKGELFLFGGAVMCLCYESRMSTKDIDAIFRPKDIFYEIIEEISEEYGLDSGWLNDGVKGFVSSNGEMEEYEIFSNLVIYKTKIDYLLAMKCMSCRLEEDSKDLDDIQFLISKMQLHNPKEVEDIILKYFSPNLILPKVSFMLGTMDYS